MNYWIWISNSILWLCDYLLSSSNS